MLTRRQLLSQSLAAPLLAQTGAKRPNIVFLFSDDHHFQALGAAGNPHIKTPNLDRLAAGGVRFVNGVVSTSQCNPSRGIMLSGREAVQTGLESNGRTDFTKDIGPSVVEQLRRSGYDTVQIGKWHVTPKQKAMGFNRAPLWLAGGSSKYQDPKLRRGLDGADEVVEGHITDLFTNAAIEEVKRPRQEPYFLWLAYNAPHGPLYADEKFTDLYAAKSNAQLAPPLHASGGTPFNWGLYYAAISQLDDAIGRLFQAIEAAGQWDNTVIFFVGDNGFMCGTRGWNGKVVHWDESIRVPLLAGGGPVKKAVVNDAVGTIDVSATWLDLAGVKPERPLAGRSLVSYLKTGKGTVDGAFCSWVDGRKEGLTTGVAVEPYRLVRTDRYKLVVFESRKKELYDCITDVGEHLNLINDPRSTALRQRMEAKLRARLKAIGDPALAWM
ncbi:MAG: sulfatase-like hydrolase/transferase [Bryobacterales bacterium]|nr:sulfatase-like hydrolase/transferase [Bryobacterales bacterium]